MLSGVMARRVMLSGVMARRAVASGVMARRVMARRVMARRVMARRVMARRVMLSGAVPSGVTASNSQPTGGAGCGESASCATAPNSGGEGAAHQVSPTHQGRGVRRVRELRHGPEQEWGRPPRAGKARQNCHGPGGRILNYKPFSNSHPRRQIITVTNPRSPRLASPAGSWNRRV